MGKWEKKNKNKNEKLKEGKQPETYTARKSNKGSKVTKVDKDPNSKSCKNAPIGEKPRWQICSKIKN
uniref:Uncharacterized protein n=1 Tax=Rhizophora mucronata TaxID=61149 RepID=A0A2P2QZA4_RHIMU